jgi:hypothetical protein
MSKRFSLVDFLPIDHKKETAFLIKWDRESMTFHIYQEGKPVHFSSFEALMDACREVMRATQNEEGVCTLQDLNVPDPPEEVPDWMKGSGDAN